MPKFTEYYKPKRNIYRNQGDLTNYMTAMLTDKENRDKMMQEKPRNKEYQRIIQKDKRTTNNKGRTKTKNWQSLVRDRRTQIPEAGHAGFVMYEAGNQYTNIPH